MRTLCIDIGGTGIKGTILDGQGTPMADPMRVPTPQPASPDPILDVIEEMARALGEFDRVSIGFPGVVMDNVTKTAPHLDNEKWKGYPLAEAVERRLARPVRVANDAGIQGLAVIEGRGLEMVLTFGTGLGCALYIDGHYVPNLELGHHPYGKRDLKYEDRVFDAECKRIGPKRWNKRVRQVIAQLEPIFNYRKLYLGGGNARLLDVSRLPENVVVVDNVAGLLGGIKLWA
ncbi:chromosome partitioning protein ParA [Sorangium cellulosum]|uniref:Chromosome partitioning protein ParA n=1 Tax=Sorangium cellulosum TaxID=56 RepID=A0A150TS23_SORCE|nr:chromosome partitioning protein ParA [Sorangium cellulosum]